MSQERKAKQREAARRSRQKVRQRGTQHHKKPNYRNFNDLRFWTEKEFEKWFHNNYALFGLKRLIDTKQLYPDVVAETYGGKKLFIELELCAPNFIAHDHDPALCDLIIAFLKPHGLSNISGVPVIAVFNAQGLRKGMANYDPKSLRLTDYFQRMVETFQRQLEAAIATD